MTFNLDKAEDYWYHKDTERICEYFYLIMLVLNEECLNSLMKNKGISIVDKEYLQKFIKELKAMNEDADLRMWQDRYDIYLWDLKEQQNHATETGLTEGRAEGRAEGLTQGIEQNKLENAWKMLLDNVSLDLVKKYTDLPLTKIKELQKSLANS